MKHENSLSEALASKQELIKAATLAVFAALAIGILAGIVVEIASSYIGVISAACILIILGTLAILVRQLLGSLTFSDKLEATVIFDSKAGSLIDVRGYKYARELCRVIDAVKAENKAIHAEWTNDPLFEKRKPKSIPDTSEGLVWYAIAKVTIPAASDGQSAAIQFLEEVTAFIILEELSLHLSSHFTNKGDQGQLVELVRDDIPEFLLKNRILNLLSTPIEQREIFLNAFPDPEKRPEGEIYGLFGSNGAMFQRFDLTLPAKGKVTNIGKNGFGLETDRFALQVSLQYVGNFTPISASFARDYIGCSFRDIQSRSVVIRVSGRIKPFSLLNSTGWEYHDWLDSFRARLRRNFHFEQFLEDIHWKIIEPLLYAGRSRPPHAPRKRMSMKPSPTSVPSSNSGPHDPAAKQDE